MVVILISTLEKVEVNKLCWYFLEVTIKLTLKGGLFIYVGFIWKSAVKKVKVNELCCYFLKAKIKLTLTGGCPVGIIWISTLEKVNKLCWYFLEATIKLTLPGGCCGCHLDINPEKVIALLVHF